MVNSSPGNDDTRAQQVIDAVRTLILRHHLAPGQHIRQEELAARLGVSRSPLREALSALTREGLVRHAPNQGYFVARLHSNELEQVYLMRELLETAVLRTVPIPSDKVLRNLRKTNALIKRARGEDAISETLRANRQFHFDIFALSPLALVTEQIDRLWNLSESYRAAYLAIPETRERIIDEHEAIIDAISRGDTETLIQLADAHRGAAKISVQAYLRASEPLTPMPVIAAV